MISPLIKWNHSADWKVANYQDKINSCERIVTVSLKEDDFEFISGHIVDKRNLFPATGYLYLVWKTLSLTRRKRFADFSVVFEDIKFLKTVVVSTNEAVQLLIVIQKGNYNNLILF